jgi:hypothetical protein
MEMDTAILFSVHTDHRIWPTEIHNEAGLASPRKRGMFQWPVPSDEDRAEFSSDLIHRNDFMA